MTLQRRADGAQDKHGLRSEPRKCELCGQLVVSVCDSLDMGEAVTCHYEPATEDEKAKRIAELEAENAALRDVNKRLNNDANLLMESNAQLTEENAALRQDAAILSALCGDDSLVLEAAALTKRQQVAEAFLNAALQGDSYQVAADWFSSYRLPTLAAVLEEAAREEQDA